MSSIDPFVLPTPFLRAPAFLASEANLPKLKIIKTKTSRVSYLSAVSQLWLILLKEFGFVSRAFFLIFKLLTVTNNCLTLCILSEVWLLFDGMCQRRYLSFYSLFLSIFSEYDTRQTDFDLLECLTRAVDVDMKWNIEI